MPARPENDQKLRTKRTLAAALTAGCEDPAELALLMASSFYSHLDVDAYLALIDQYAERARLRLGRARTPARVISAINAVLFEEEGFRGNVDDYYDPRNSFLNEVLDSRRGIPISLSALYLAVAHRMKQPISGVGLPLHFIVKYENSRGELLIDPFNSGQILTRDECKERTEKAYGEPVEFQDSYLDSVPPRLMLYRMLTNLKFIYLKRLDFDRTGDIIDLMLEVEPNQPDEIRDRGLIHYQNGNWSGAARRLQQYLEAFPGASDADTVAKRFQEAIERRAILN